MPLVALSVPAIPQPAQGVAIGVGRNELAYFRAVIQTPSARVKLARTYLTDAHADDESPEGHDRGLRWANRRFRDVRQRLVHACLRLGDTDSAARLTQPLEELADPAPPPEAPTLEAFREAYDPDGALSEKALIQDYLDRYPAAVTDRGAANRWERAIHGLLDIVARVERARGELTAEARLEAWLHPSDVRRLGAVHVATYGEYLRFREIHGKAWRRRVPKLGVLGARRIEAFLAGEAARAPAVRVQALLPILQRCPVALDGSQGVNRAPREHRRGTDADTDLGAMEAWLASRRKTDTRVSYRREAERLLLWCVTVLGKPLSSMTNTDCRAYLDFLEDPGKVLAKLENHQVAELWLGTSNGDRDSPAWRPLRGPLAPSSIAQARTIVAGMSLWLVRAGYLQTDPWALLAKDVANAPRLKAERHITDQQHQLFRDWLAGQKDTPATLRLRAVVALLLDAGLRRSEPADLETGARDPGRPQIFIEPVDGEDMWFAAFKGKGEKARLVAFPPDAVAALEAYFEARGLDRDPRKHPAGTPVIATLTRGRAKNAWVHSSDPAGEATIYRVIKEAFKRAADELESDPAAALFRKVSPHWLRHSKATRFAREAPIQAVQQLLGHASLQTTSIYVKTDLQDLGRAVRAASGKRATTG